LPADRFVRLRDSLIVNAKRVQRLDSALQACFRRQNTRPGQ
jgi:hypothetical protein